MEMFQWLSNTELVQHNNILTLFSILPTISYPSSNVIVRLSVVLFPNSYKMAEGIELSITP